MREGNHIYGFTAGEPAGIGAEIIAKALRRLTLTDRKSEENSDFFLDRNHKFLIYGDRALLAPHFIAQGVTVTEVTSPAEIKRKPGRFYLQHLPLSVIPAPGVPDLRNGENILTTIKTATQDALTGEIAGIVTAPVDKSVIHAYDPDFYGHTEYISGLCSAFHKRDFHPVMMLTAKGLRTIPFTVHIALRSVPEKITEEGLIRTAKIIIAELQEKYGIAAPRLAVCGLNPHAGEGGTLGNEEITVISPAIRRLQAEGLRVSGAFAADSLFHAAARENYDAVLCMYHDQALIPVKTLGFDEGVNVTLGLPIRRASPDHGTAYDIAGKNMANEQSFLCALQEIVGNYNDRITL